MFTSLSSSGEEGFLSRCPARAPWRVTGKSSHEVAVITAHSERVARWTLQPSWAPLHTPQRGASCSGPGCACGYLPAPLEVQEMSAIWTPPNSPPAPIPAPPEPRPSCCSPQPRPASLPSPHIHAAHCPSVLQSRRLHLENAPEALHTLIWTAGHLLAGPLPPCQSTSLLHVRAHPSSKTADLPAASHAGHTAARTTQPLPSRDGHPLPCWTCGRAPGWSVTQKAGSV